MTDQQKAVPGWYPGSVPGEERWWDGTAWTAYARPAAAPGQPAGNTAPQRAGIWRGSKEGSLIVAILCVALTFPTGLAVVWGLLSGSIAFLIPGLAWLMFVAFAVLLFLNYFGLRRQEAAIRQAATVQPTATR